MVKFMTEQTSFVILILDPHLIRASEIDTYPLAEALWRGVSLAYKKFKKEL